jgi:hypothetical protein
MHAIAVTSQEFLVISAPWQRHPTKGLPAVLVILVVVKASLSLTDNVATVAIARISGGHYGLKLTVTCGGDFELPHPCHFPLRGFLLIGKFELNCLFLWRGFIRIRGVQKFGLVGCVGDVGGRSHRSDERHGTARRSPARRSSCTNGEKKL